MRNLSDRITRLCLVGLGLVAVLLVGVVGISQAQEDTAPTPTSEATVEELFADFLHFAVIGRFDIANAYAEQLLKHPDLEPTELLAISEKHKNSVETLTTLVAHSSLGTNAQRVLEVIHQGEQQERLNPTRIKANIQRLGGSPQAEFNAIKHLEDSGEHAIPWMIAALQDPEFAKLQTRIVRAVPHIGKPAVNPLVQALEMGDTVTRSHVIKALGEIGYPQAIPYLKKLLADEKITPTEVKLCEAAIGRIAGDRRDIADRPAAKLFADLAEDYYEQRTSVRADVRLDRANVWYWRDGFLLPVAVPREIFGDVMAMRCCEEALELDPSLERATALWLAANIRREAHLGMDVESTEADARAAADETHPDDMPRSIYFTRTAGARAAHQVLARAIKDRDAAVALGAIAALRVVAGSSNLVGTEDYKQPLVEALTFPNILVRIKAALVLGRALPEEHFRGDDLVTPVLGEAVGQTGKRYVVIVNADQDQLNRLMGEMRDADTEVIGEGGLLKALDRARRELPTVNAIFMSTNIADPDVSSGLRSMRGDFMFASAPVVILAEDDGRLVAENLTAEDVGAGMVDAGESADALTERWMEVAGRVGQLPLHDDEALVLALNATETLRLIAVDGRTVYQYEQAEPNLIRALARPDESLKLAAMQTLLLFARPAAQQAIASVGLDAGQSESVRMAAFAALSESGKRNGSLLTEDQVAELLELAMNDDDLVMRTAASRALGALNISSDRSSEVILKYHGG